MKPVSNLKWLVAINLGLGALLWFTFLTDYSLTGALPDLLLPPTAALIAFVSFGVIKKHNWTSRRRLVKLALLPSIVGGGLYVFVAILVLLPPYTLGAFFTISEISSETRIQQAVSPDGARVASVYFRGVGVYSGGNGRIFVCISPRALPFLERDVYYLRVSSADRDTPDYVRWIDNDTLYISETGEEISVGVIQAEIPLVIAIPLNMAKSVVANAEKQRIENELSTPVRDIPIYPDKFRGDHTEYSDIYETAERFYFLPQNQVDEVASWYQEKLSQDGWNLAKVERRPKNEGHARHEYCIQAERPEQNQTRLYYWEITEVPGEGGTWQVRVTVSTPHPTAGACYQYRQ
jgi:hypothetical protein